MGDMVAHLSAVLQHRHTNAQPSASTSSTLTRRQEDPTPRSLTTRPEYMYIQSCRAFDTSLSPLVSLNQHGGSSVPTPLISASPFSNLLGHYTPRAKSYSRSSLRTSEYTVASQQDREYGIKLACHLDY